MSHFRKAVLLSVLVAGLLPLFPSRAEAVVLDKSSYIVGDSIIAPDGTGPVVLYNLGTGETYFETWGFDPGGNINYFGISSGNFSLIELTTSGICQGQALTYVDCKLAPEFVGEALFSVTDPPSSGRAAEPADRIVPVPIAAIQSPLRGDVFSLFGIINYTTLSATKVNLYYSTSTANWDGSFFIDPADKMLIASGVPENGPYTWNTKGLAPGNFYRFIVDALGTYGRMGEAISGFFSLDFTPPTFIVKANPPVTRGSDVTVSVDASKNLKVPPTVTVTQASGVATSLEMKGQGSHYEGTYVISKGHDGVATISVSGSDVAGNVGTTILSGGTFAVGINPPPVPHISSPQNNTVVATSTIAVTGTVRPDTMAVLVVNGVDTYTASSSLDGTFHISGIVLSKDANRGANVFSIAARDQAGLMSEAVPLQIKYNIAPTVAISSPADKAIVGATTLLTVQAKDENTDPLLFTYQIIPAQSFDEASAATTSSSTVKHSVFDSAWNTIGDAVPSANFSWDSTEVEDGQYFLRAIADDGFVKVYSTPTPFSIHNTISFFRFEDGRKTVTNRLSATIVGHALSPVTISPRPAIVSVEYSLNNGVKWSPVSITSGEGSANVTFSLALTKLAEGTQNIVWRVKDSRGLYGRASHPVIVDLTPPAVPIVNSPANNAFITNADDEDASQSGLQISVTGTAEPQSMVTLQSASTTLTARASIDGVFTFRAVDMQRGTNQFTVTAKDEAGNASVSRIVRVVYDNPPTVTILTPKPFRGLTGKASVSWSVSDIDGDKIQQVRLEYRRGSGAFIPLDLVKHSVLDTPHIFDVRDFPEAADYQLRLSAGDGIATGTDLVSFSVDRTPPTLSSFTLDTSVVGKGGTLTGHGKAYDALSGIEYVEYAIAEGAPSTFSTALLTNGFLQNNATFSLAHPTTLIDSTYTVYARAVDAAGNVSPQASRTVLVDMAPPSIGSFDVLVQGARVSPDEQGVIALYTGAQSLFEVSLEGDTKTASLFVGSTAIPLKKDIASGLWQVAIDVGTAGTTTLAISAEDNVHNAVTGKLIGALHITDRPSDAPAQPSTGGTSGVWKFLQGIINYILSL
ncbi:MAG: Ig-like domain-containing protein [Minisyncoccia bacterium]